MTILVVDDSSAIRYMLRILLEDAGMEVEEAASGLDALARLGSRRAPAVQCVVLDQRMPDLTGLEVARELVLAGEHPQLFLYSSYLHPVQEAEAAELGVTALVKTDLDELVAGASGGRDLEHRRAQRLERLALLDVATGHRATAPARASARRRSPRTR